MSDALATPEAVLLPDEKEEGVAVVDVGGGVTDVTVYYRNVVRYVASIPMGASAINRDIRTMSVPEKHVESLKQKYGSAVAELAPEDKLIRVNGRTAREAKDILLRNLATVIEARATDIAEFVQQEIRDSGYAGKLAYGIVLTGGSAKLKDLDELFRRVTGMEVRIGTAEEAVDGDVAGKGRVRRPTRRPSDCCSRGAAHGDCAVTEYPASGRCGTVRRADDPARDPLLCREARDRRFGSALHTAAPRPHRLPRRRLPRRTPQRKGRRKGPQPKPPRRPHRPKRGLLDKLKQKLGTRLDDFFTGSEDEEMLSRPTGQGGGKPKQYERENAKPAGNRNERPTKKRLRNYE